jgi:hypothetical protein
MTGILEFSKRRELQAGFFAAGNRLPKKTGFNDFNAFFRDLVSVQPGLGGSSIANAPSRRYPMPSEANLVLSGIKKECRYRPLSNAALNKRAREIPSKAQIRKMPNDEGVKEGAIQLSREMRAQIKAAKEYRRQEPFGIACQAMESMLCQNPGVVSEWACEETGRRLARIAKGIVDIDDQPGTREAFFTLLKNQDFSLDALRLAEHVCKNNVGKGGIRDALDMLNSCIKAVG